MITYEQHLKLAKLRLIQKKINEKLKANEEATKVINQQIEMFNEVLDFLSPKTSRN